MSYSTVRMQPGHRDAVLRLLKENLNDLRTGDALDARFQWSYAQNPEGAAETVLAVHDAGGDIIGCGSAYPRTLYVGGTAVKAGIPADFVVTRAHRIGAAAVGIQRALVSDNQSGFSLFIGFPYKTSLAVLQRVGYRPFASARAWVKPLRTAYKLRAYLKSDWMARVTAGPLDACLAVADRWRTARRPATRSEITRHADGRFDALWNASKDRYAVTGERTSAYLNWRYGRYTTLTYEFFCLARAADGALLGYVAYFTKNGKVFVGDLFARDMDDTADLLLLQFARTMRKHRHDSIFISYAGNPDFASRLERIGFFSKGNQERNVVALVKGLTREQEELLFDARNWHLFDGEMDI